MKESPTHPIRSLRTVAALARWMVRLTLLMVLALVCAWAWLYAWVVPRADTYRPWLERQASEQLGMEVRIAEVSAWRAGWLPTLALHQIEIANPQTPETLSIQQIVLALTPQSLWGGNLAQVVVDAPHLEVRQTAEGGWQIGPWAWAPQAASSSRSEDHAAVADWFFSQPEVVVRRGSVDWVVAAASTDAPAVVHHFTDLSFLMRNGLWRHELRVQVQPPAAMGDALTVVGRFREPLFRTDPRHWSGQWYAQWLRADLAALQASWPQGMQTPFIPVLAGQGGLRLWGDVKQGRWQGVTADVAFQGVQMQWGERPALNWQRLDGRVEGRWEDNDVLQVHLQDLQVQSQDMAQPLRHALHLRYAMTPGRDQGALQLDQLDLDRWSQWAQALPWSDELAKQLRAHSVQGQLEQLSWNWTGNWQTPRTYQLDAHLKGFTTGGEAPSKDVWGVAGLQAQLSASERGGQAQVQIEEGHLVLPGVFEEALVPVDQLTTTVRWIQEKDRTVVELPDLQFANADAAGTARLQWHTGEDGADRLPGVLDLQGRLDRANGARVYRYLPLDIPEEARYYVRDAIVSGVADRTTFKVQGDLAHMPFDQPGTGVFQIKAQVRDVIYDYVPRGLQEPAELPWPRLTRLAGLLVFEGAGMEVRNAQAQMDGMPDVVLKNIQARIPDLEHTRVDVRAQAHGPLASLLRYVRQSPVDAMTDWALTQAEASGEARLDLQLDLPIDALETSRVQGEVFLQGNRLRLMPEMPWLSAARGSVRFSEQGFSLQNVQAQALGGALHAEGQMQVVEGQPVQLQVRIEGEASDQGLREAGGMVALAQLGTMVRGQTRYELLLQTVKGLPQWTIRTDLKGMEVLLPAPMAKRPEETRPVRYVQKAQESTDALQRARVEVQITGHLDALLELSTSGAQWNLEQGRIHFGAEPAAQQALPEQGLEVALQWPMLDADVWMDWLAGAMASAAAPDSHAAAAGAVAKSPLLQSATVLEEVGTDLWASYLPQRVRLQVDALQLQGRRWHDVQIAGLRQGKQWQAQVQAREMAGQLRYDPEAGAAGALHARLQRLEIARAPESAAEPAVIASPDALSQARELPALDIAVEELVVQGRSLGRLELQARNRVAGGAPSSWHLQHLELRMPEALLRAQGHWRTASHPVEGESQTALEFTLELADAGKLLHRWGYVDVLRQGAGLLQGQLQWAGSPIEFNARTLQGQVEVQVGQGQFLKAEPGMAKLLSVLSLQSLPRRLQLDFRDIFSEGFAFDHIQGQVHIDRGVAQTDSLEMRGLNAAVLMKGQADIVRETQQLQVIVVPEINAMTASLLAATINPVVGVGSLLAQWALRGPLMEAATQVFQIHGTWDAPAVEKVDASTVRATGSP